MTSASVTGAARPVTHSVWTSAADSSGLAQEIENWLPKMPEGAIWATERSSMNISCV
jgi:hypothetical protein